MKALISPLENNRICEIAENDFPIAEPLFWVDCPNNATTEWGYKNGLVVERIADPETPEETVARLERALDAYIDNQAQSYRYESIRTMVTYENDPNPKFNAEGVGAKAFRSAVYTLGVSLIGEVQSGLREVPTEEELLALMPKLEDFVTY